MAKTTYDMVVIGGGSGGLVVAGAAAQLGARTLLIEKHRLGGECLWTGCVPSKAFIRAARYAADVRRASDFGVEIGYERIDYSRVIDRVRDVILTIEPHDSPERMESMGVEVRFGSVRFVGPRTLELDGEIIESRNITVSTGTSPLVPPVPGLRDIEHLTNENVFSERRLPQRLAVIGAGPIGLELGQSFARFGSEVTVVEMLGQVLPREDPELAAVVMSELESEGVRFRLQTKVVAVEQGTSGKLVSVERAVEDRQGGPAVDQLEVDAILVAVGRRPNLDGLDLEAAGVHTDRSGIPVDDRMRSNVRHIYACGDVTGRFLFTHAAELQAKTVVTNAILGLPSKIDERVLPWATFTEPELAHVGMTEAEARASGVRHVVYRFPMDHVDRAITDGRTSGLIKIIATPWRGKILGAHIVGESAGDLISEFTLAMQHGISVEKITRTVHVYPTLALGNRRAADQMYARFLKPGLIRWIKRLRGLRGTVPERDPDALL